MPLIIISGYPASGKTHRARQIVEYFESRISAAQASLAANQPAASKPVTSAPPTASSTSLTSHARLHLHHISDARLALPRSVYGSARLEKDARATAYSAVKRVLGPSDVVVLDGLNYIKGWRYQLYCEAKAASTGCCVVHVGATPERCRTVNETRLKGEAHAAESSLPSTDAMLNAAGDTTAEVAMAEGKAATDADADPYPPDIFDNLLERYEEPSALARWDSPLFFVPWEDVAPPCEAIWAALLSPAGSAVRGKAARPNLATALKPATTHDHLYEVERVTGKLVASVREWIDANERLGGSVQVNVGAGKGAEVWRTVEVPATGGVGFAKLQRLKRQFVSLHRQQMTSMSGDSGGGGAMLDKDRVGDLFVDYLNDQLSAG